MSLFNPLGCKRRSTLDGVEVSVGVGVGVWGRI